MKDIAMIIGAQSNMMTASLLLAQTDAAKAEVLTQNENHSGTVDDLRRERAQAESSHISHILDRISKKEILTNDPIDDVNRRAEHYRVLAQKLMEALVRLVREDRTTDPNSPQATAETATIDTPVAHFVLVNMNRLRADEVRLRLETEYVEYKTGAGNDAVSVIDKTVNGMRTGNGSDAVSIVADRVYSVETDADRRTTASVFSGKEGGNYGEQKTYSNADSLSIIARDVQQVRTGGGADAIAIQSRLIRSVDAGSGNDALALRGGLVENVVAGSGDDIVNITAVQAYGIDGGKGDDVISVHAEQGRGSIRDLYRPGQNGLGKDMYISSISNADLEGGAGNDTMYIRADKHLSVEGGLGDDRLHLEGGTVALKYRNGDGQDHISLGEGVTVLVDLAHSARFTISETDAGLTLQFEDGGSMTFEGVENAANLIVRNGEGTHVLKQDGAFDATNEPFAPLDGMDMRV